MSKHKTEDYKLQAVKYYLRSDKSLDEVCRIFDCSRKSLFRWVDRYVTEKQIKRHSQQSISYKIKNKHVRYALELLKENKHMSMEYLAKKINFDVTFQHLGNDITV